MARSVFYYHLKRLKTRDKYADEKDMIKSIFNERKGRYGDRKRLEEQGIIQSMSRKGNCLDTQ